MDVKSNITHKAEVKLVDNEVSCTGSYQVVERLQKYKNEYGADPKQWPVKPVQDDYDIMINEFILKCQDQYRISYSHAEMCHCRTVPTETVIQSIKQNCHTVKEISRNTKAGTGCGTCVPNIKVLLSEILNKS